MSKTFSTLLQYLGSLKEKGDEKILIRDWEKKGIMMKERKRKQRIVVEINVYGIKKGC